MVWGLKFRKDQSVTITTGKHSSRHQTWQQEQRRVHIVNHKQETERANLERQKSCKPQSSPQVTHFLQQRSTSYVSTTIQQRRTRYSNVQTIGNFAFKPPPRTRKKLGGLYQSEIILHKGVSRYWLLTKYTEMNIRGKGRINTGCII